LGSPESLASTAASHMDNFTRCAAADTLPDPLVSKPFESTDVVEEVLRLVDESDKTVSLASDAGTGYCVPSCDNTDSSARLGSSDAAMGELSGDRASLNGIPVLAGTAAESSQEAVRRSEHVDQDALLPTVACRVQGSDECKEQQGEQLAPNATQAFFGGMHVREPCSGPQTQGPDACVPSAALEQEVFFDAVSVAGKSSGPTSITGALQSPRSCLSDVEGAYSRMGGSRSCSPQPSLQSPTPIVLSQAQPQKLLVAGPTR
jgi:hypothetical protein